MRTQDEVEYALANVQKEIAGIGSIDCPSEQAAAAGHAPKLRGMVNAFEWLLAGERPVLLVNNYFVARHREQAFRDFVAHYDDEQKDGLVEEAREHYENWRDSAEPGDQYTRSENDPAPEYEPQVWIRDEEQGETGCFFTLGFPDTGAVFDFAANWAGVVLMQEMATTEEKGAQPNG